MEVHQLRYMVAVARTGNFSRAAEECHVSQPSLSQQIHKLEQELGDRLFDRLRREARLTTTGKRFLPRALRVLQEIAAAEREAKEASELLQGRVVVGVLPTIAPFFLPGVVADFRNRYPGIEVVVQEDTTHNLLKLAAAGELDMAIASLPILDNRFEWTELFTEELLLAVPRSHRLATKRSVASADLDHERFILMQEDHCLGDQILGFCNRSDIQPEVSCRSVQIQTILALIQSGLGISLIPAMAAVGRDGTSKSCPANPLMYRSLTQPRPERAVVAVWPKARPPGRAVNELISCARGQVRRQ